MNIISLQIQTCTKKKKPFHAIKCLQTLSHNRALSSHRPKRIERSDKALRVLDIISPKTRPHASSQLHLRLIQDFLQRDSNNAKHCTPGFASSDSTLGLSNVFDEILGSSVFSEENPVSTHFDMHDKGLKLDASFLSIAVSSCGSTRDFGGGIQYHCLAIQCGFAANVYVGSALISFYSKCCRVYSAYKLFEETLVRNVVSWTAIIAAFAQEWEVNMCLDLYGRMRDSTLKPNEFTFTSILSACMGSGALGQGRNVHCQTIRMGFDMYIHVANALISMYCKCGSVDDAFCVFNNIASKDIVSWNSMIAGYAQHGLGIEANDLFEEMKKQSVKPDAITYLGVLSSCCHAGLVEEGKLCFDSMVEDGLKPELDHYSCVVDLLGRAGLVEEAQEFIKKMPIRPNAVIWGSLLSSCRHHGAIWIGIQAAESRLLLEPECAATHVQLANLYASVKCWDQAARVRKLMKDKGLKTRTGYSWIEIKNEVYRFRAEDKSNTRLREILAVLECFVNHMKISVFKPEIEVEDFDDALNESL